MAFGSTRKKRTWKKRIFRKAPWNSWKSQSKRRKRYPLHMGAKEGAKGDTKTLCMIPIRPNEVMLQSTFKYRFISTNDVPAHRLTVQRITAFQIPASIFSNAQDGPGVANQLGRLELDTGTDIVAGGDTDARSDIRETLADPDRVDNVMAKIIEGYNHDAGDLQARDSADAGVDADDLFDQLWKQPLMKRRKTMNQLGIKVLKNSLTPLAPVFNTSTDDIRVGQEQDFKLSSPQGKGRFYTSNKLTYIVFCFTNFDMATNEHWGGQWIGHPAHLLPPKMADARYELFGGYGGNDVGMAENNSKEIFRRLKSLYHLGDHFFEYNTTHDVEGTGTLVARPKIATDLPRFTPN